MTDQSKWLSEQTEKFHGFKELSALNEFVTIKYAKTVSTSTPLLATTTIVGATDRMICLAAQMICLSYNVLKIAEAGGFVKFGSSELIPNMVNDRIKAISIEYNKEPGTFEVPLRLKDG